ncbi:transmembrane amino acid transporter protein-domain-containing protein [Dichotomocladium elegans]|nr:transmembrane amino acid transporter protein-domain-containing protein [Dichotomocladium elegans]
MVLAGQKLGVYKLADLSERVLGRFGFHLSNLMLFAQSAGSCISYFILIADTIPVLLNLYFPNYTFNRELVTIILSIFVVFPLNLPRSIGALAAWSTVSVLLLPVMIITVLARAPTYARQHEAPLNVFGKDPIAAAGIMSFALVCSQVAFNNFLSQRNQSSKAWSATSALSTFMSWSISITFALIGYLSFGKDVDSNIFANFPGEDNIINIGRLALGLSMILTVPMAFYPTRDAIQKTLGFETADRQPTALEHYGITTILFVGLLAMGVTVHSLGKVYAVVGGLASAYLAYTLPAISYISAFHPSWLRFCRRTPGDGTNTVFSDEDGEHEPLLLSTKVLPRPSRWLDGTSIFLVLFGTVIMFFTAINAFK